MPRAITQIALGIVVQILAISCWFSTAAAMPSLSSSFALDDAARVLLIACVQGGFAVGAALVAWGRVADRVRPGVLVPVGALATAAVTVIPLTAPDDLALLYVSRMLAGIALAAVYPAGMRATVSWASPRWRGLAVAGVVASLTVGTAAPHLLRASPIVDWRAALLVCALAAVSAALLGLLLREGPYVARRGASARVAVAGSERGVTPMRVSLAYVGHMWEVYGLWVWLPALLVAVPATRAVSGGGTAFAIIGIAGAGGCMIGGLLAARYGKRRVALASAALSGTCALLCPFLPLVGTSLALVMLAVWSAAAIADSALYSALLGDVSHPERVGTAIALQMGVGYALTIVVIAALPALAAIVGWPTAMLVLALGPLASVGGLLRWSRSQPRPV